MKWPWLHYVEEQEVMLCYTCTSVVGKHTVVSSLSAVTGELRMLSEWYEITACKKKKSTLRVGHAVHAGIASQPPTSKLLPMRLYCVN